MPGGINALAPPPLIAAEPLAEAVAPPTLNLAGNAGLPT
jgi:hypothetical protein